MDSKEEVANLEWRETKKFSLTSINKQGRRKAVGECNKLGERQSRMLSLSFIHEIDNLFSWKETSASTSNKTLRTRKMEVTQIKLWT